MTHWRPARAAFRSRPIVGRATLTMVLSRRESPLPRTVVRTTARPRGSLTRNAAGPGIAGPGAAGPGVQGPGAGITRSILLAPRCDPGDCSLLNSNRFRGREPGPKAA